MDLNSNKASFFEFEVLFICNGHYSKPWLPKFHEKYQKEWIHSHNYRSPKPYKEKIVGIVGAAYSGLDILPQISEVAKKVAYHIKI